MASKRHLRRKSCNKAKHKTNTDALVELCKVKRQLILSGIKPETIHLNIYRCHFCGQFHIGHRPRFAYSS